MSSPARLREPEVLAAQLSALRTVGKRTGSTFCLGAMEALRWLTEGGPGPLTGALIGRSVTFRAIVRELSAAEAVIYEHPSEQRRYAEGVEHALMWAQFTTPAPPAPPTPPAPSERGGRAGVAAHHTRLPRSTYG
ncbi:hypothetical protein [Pseudonocardia sp. T1-2H]|uniref:hypothetical protein n=1 Tax=Pseudonocardia sp. T1-2H TaxID=3128899 RepID=UPI003100CBFC